VNKAADDAAASRAKPSAGMPIWRWAQKPRQMLLTILSTFAFSQQRRLRPADASAISRSAINGESPARAGLLLFGGAAETR